MVIWFYFGCWGVRGGGRVDVGGSKRFMGSVFWLISFLVFGFNLRYCCFLVGFVIVWNKELYVLGFFVVRYSFMIMEVEVVRIVLRKRGCFFIFYCWNDDVIIGILLVILGYDIRLGKEVLIGGVIR